MIQYPSTNTGVESVDVLFISCKSILKGGQVKNIW